MAGSPDDPSKLGKTKGGKPANTNALQISAAVKAAVTPDAMRHAAERIAGKVSVDRLSVVARLKRVDKQVAEEMAREVEQSIRQARGIWQAARGIEKLDKQPVKLPRYVHELRAAAKVGGKTAVREVASAFASQLERLGEVQPDGTLKASPSSLRGPVKRFVASLQKAGPADVDAIVAKHVQERAAYRAKVIARHESVEAMRSAYQERAAANPQTIGFRWQLSQRHDAHGHGKGTRMDECDIYANQNSYGLGAGVYPVGKVPRTPHPSCLCSQVAVTSREQAKDTGERAPLQPDQRDTKSPDAAGWLRANPGQAAAILGPTRHSMLKAGRDVLDANGKPLLVRDLMRGGAVAKKRAVGDGTYPDPLAGKKKSASDKSVMDAAAKMKAREAAARAAAAAEARRKAQEAAAKSAQDAAARKAAEAERQRLAAEEAARKAAEEAARKAQEAAAKRAAEEAAKKAAEEAAKRAAEQAAKRAAEEAAKRKAAEEAARKAAEQAAKEAAKRKAAEEAAAKKAAKEAARKAAEEAKRLKAESDAAAKLAAEKSKKPKGKFDLRKPPKDLVDKIKKERGWEKVYGKEIGERMARSAAREEMALDLPASEMMRIRDKLPDGPRTKEFIEDFHKAMGPDGTMRELFELNPLERDSYAHHAALIGHVHSLNAGKAEELINVDLPWETGTSTWSDGTMYHPVPDADKAHMLKQAMHGASELAKISTAKGLKPYSRIAATGDGRAFATRGLIAMAPGNEVRTYAHELVHTVEYVNHDMGKRSHEWVERRSVGKPLRKLRDIYLERLGVNRAFSDEEVAFDDPKVVSPYVMKKYGEYIPGRSNEVVTVGTEHVIGRPEEEKNLRVIYNKDPDHLHFTLSQLAEM